MYPGADNSVYMSNIPPWRIFIKYLAERGLDDVVEHILSHLNLG
jgi:hypothetical protein